MSRDCPSGGGRNKGEQGFAELFHFLKYQSRGMAFCIFSINKRNIECIMPQQPQGGYYFHA